VLSGVRTLSVATGAAVITAVGSTFMIAGAASAAPTWLGATDLSSLSASAQAPSVAVDPEGESVAVWQQVDGNLLEASVHPPDQSWRAPAQVASDAISGPSVVLDAGGDATAAWLDTADIVQAATLPAGGTLWSAPVNVSGAGASAPQVATDPRGDTVAAWVATGGLVQASYRAAGATAWQPPIPISPTAKSASDLQVALDSQGNAVATWLLSSAGAHKVVQAATRPAVGGVWQSPVTVSEPGIDASGPALAVDPAGTATAIWSDADGIHAADRPPGGAWGSPAMVPASAGGSQPDLAVDSAGDVTAVWNQPAGSGETLAEAAQRPAGGAWQTPVALSTAQSMPPSPQVKVDARGDAIAAWDSFDGANHVVKAVNRPAGASWPAPAATSTLSTASADAVAIQLAVDPQGNATAVWDLFDGTTQLIQAAGYDGAGPLLDALSIPAAGTAGVPTTFSVAPVDVWSPVSSTTWSFGDGEQGSGETFAHTYANAGRYTVSVTSTDGLANPTSQSATITIAPAAAHTPAAPALTGVSQTRRKWREGSKQATISRRKKTKPAPVGTRFSFSINEDARVTLAFTLQAAGRKVAGRCQVPTRHNRKRPSCKRTLTRGTLSYATTAGHHTITFDGRIGAHRLPLGAYTVHITAVDAGTGQHSRAATLRFTIVK
jgi:PKD domain-containing protein